MVVPQFWQAGIALVEPAFEQEVDFSSGFGVELACCNANLAVLYTRLLNAGHPLQPCCPPVPLHLPPPGHVPAAIWSAATYVATRGDGTRFPGETSRLPVAGVGLCCTEMLDCEGVLRLRLTGRCWFLALMYSPQALQTVSPVGERRHSGVCVVLQLLPVVSIPYAHLRLRAGHLPTHMSKQASDLPTDLPNDGRAISANTPAW